MNLETKITIYKFTPQVFTLTLLYHISLFFNSSMSIFRDLSQGKYSWKAKPERT